MQKEKLQHLLNEINLVREKYQQRKDAEEKFNIFTTLIDESDEVKLHSRFISSLLDPEGPHKLGFTPLQLFLDTIGSKLEFGEKATVTPNNSTWTEYKEIDILISDRQKKYAVIVENKIYSSDSNHQDRGQLEGYYQQILAEGYNQENIEVYYLTLDHHEPSEESVCTNGRSPELKEKVQCIGYDIEIKKWLEKLVKETYNRPFIRETINQYLKLIKEMTNNIDTKEQLELTDLVGKNDDNLAAAKYIIEKHNHIYWHTIWNFIEELKKGLDGVDLKVEPIKSEEQVQIIDNIVHNKKKNTHLYLNIKDNNSTLTWTLEYDGNDDCGLYLGLRKESNKNNVKDLQKAIDNYVNTNNLQKNNYWYYLKYIKDLEGGKWLYFFDFTKTNTDTFDLINPEKRKTIIEEIVKFVKQEMEDFQSFQKK